MPGHRNYRRPGQSRCRPATADEHNRSSGGPAPRTARSHCRGRSSRRGSPREHCRGIGVAGCRDGVSSPGRQPRCVLSDGVPSYGQSAYEGDLDCDGSGDTLRSNDRRLGPETYGDPDGSHQPLAASVRMRRVRILERVAGLLLMLLVGADTGRGQAPVRVSCLPDKAIAHPGGTIGLHVWVAADGSPVPGNVAARWTVSAGRIDGQSVATHWLLEGAALDRRHAASVDVQVDGRTAGSCTLGVWVAEEEKDGVRVRGEY